MSVGGFGHIKRFCPNFLSIGLLTQRPISSVLVPIGYSGRENSRGYPQNGHGGKTIGRDGYQANRGKRHVGRYGTQTGKGGGYGGEKARLYVVPAHPKVEAFNAVITSCL